MSQIALFLHSLTDQELAFLHAYKYSTYLENSQALIDAELNWRRLDEHRRQILLSEPIIHHPAACNRCGSNKHLETEAEKWNTGKYDGLDGLVGIGRMATTTRSECTVCGQLLYDGNEQLGLWKTLRRLFARRL